MVYPRRDYLTYKRFSQLQKEKDNQLGLGEGCNLLDLMTFWQETCSFVTVIIVSVVLGTRHGGGDKVGTVTQAVGKSGRADEPDIRMIMIW